MNVLHSSINIDQPNGFACDIWLHVIFDCMWSSIVIIWIPPSHQMQYLDLDLHSCTRYRATSKNEKSFDVRCMSEILACYVDMNSKQVGESMGRVLGYDYSWSGCGSNGVYHGCLWFLLWSWYTAHQLRTWLFLTESDQVWCIIVWCQVIGNICMIEWSVWMWVNGVYGSHWMVHHGVMGEFTLTWWGYVTQLWYCSRTGEEFEITH